MTEKTDLRSPTVRVEGLPPSLEDDDFERWLMAAGIDFEQAGIVRSIEGVSRCYAFVVAPDQQAAESIAQHITGSMLVNRLVSATVGQERPRNRRAA